MPRADLRRTAPAEWALWAETRGGLADRVEAAARFRGDRGVSVGAPKGGDAHVSRGGRWAIFHRTPLLGDIWGAWGWGVQCSDDVQGPEAASHQRRTPVEALRWVMGWP